MNERHNIQDPSVSFLSVRKFAIRWANFKTSVIFTAEIGAQTNYFDTMKHFYCDEEEVLVG